MVEFVKGKFFRIMLKNSLLTIAASTIYCNLIVVNRSHFSIEGKYSTSVFKFSATFLWFYPKFSFVVVAGNEVHKLSGWSGTFSLICHAFSYLQAMLSTTAGH